jgi:hypothetical protein
MKFSARVGLFASFAACTTSSGVFLYTRLICSALSRGIAASAQALSILGSPSAQLAHPLAQAAQVLFSHLFLPLLRANHASWPHHRIMSFPSSLDDDAQDAHFMGLGP